MAKIKSLGKTYEEYERNIFKTLEKYRFTLKQTEYLRRIFNVIKNVFTPNRSVIPVQIKEFALANNFAYKDLINKLSETKFYSSLSITNFGRRKSCKYTIIKQCQQKHGRPMRVVFGDKYYCFQVCHNCVQLQDNRICDANDCPCKYDEKIIPTGEDISEEDRNNFSGSVVRGIKGRDECCLVCLFADKIINKEELEAAHLVCAKKIPKHKKLDERDGIALCHYHNGKMGTENVELYYDIPELIEHCNKLGLRLKGPE